MTAETCNGKYNYKSNDNSKGNYKSNDNSKGKCGVPPPFDFAQSQNDSKGRSNSDRN